MVTISGSEASDDCGRSTDGRGSSGRDQGGCGRSRLSLNVGCPLEVDHQVAHYV